MKELEYLAKQAKYALIAPSPKQAISAKPETILAIAEAFRALEQENILLKQGCENNPLVHEMIDWRERAEAAEAKQDCNHDWFTLHYGHTEAIYGCKKCGQYKTGQGSY